MNVITRGVKNALRSPVRSGAIVIMLAISIGLILSMLVARSSVNTKNNEVKAATATAITVSPAGIQGGMGGGDPLTTDQVATITKTAHVVSVVSTLTDQMGASDTNLTPSLTLGAFGKRQQRFEQQGTSGSAPTPPAGESTTDSATTTRRTPTPRTTVTGTSTPTSIVTADKITAGATIDGTSSDTVALVGKTLAEKNNLTVGSTFTAYGKTFTVKGIYSLGNTFQDSGAIVPLATLQNVTSQPGAVSSVTATVDSSDNVATTVASLKASLADKADVTSEQEQATTSLQPLQSIANLALAGVIAAVVAGALIILLSMVMVVRERRREIGVIKAIGGTNSTVVAQFITEALTLTAIGGIVGLGLGIAVSGPITSSLVSSQTTTTNSQSVGRLGGFPGRGSARVLNQQLNTSIKNVTKSITPATFAISAGLVLLIAIIGSAIPAWFIARIRPAEVLRTE